MLNILQSKLSIEYPIIQAAMGGGIATAELVCAVSKAGGLGSLGISPIKVFRNEINTIKHELSAQPFSINLLLPLTTSAHIKTVIKQKVPNVSIFYGYKKGLIKALKEAGCVVSYQVGSLQESAKVIAEGADFLIAQGQEAGGHLRGSMPLAALLNNIKHRFPEIPVIAAGGIYNSESVRNAMALGADGISAGTRFLMSTESGAHQAYKQKLIANEQTVVTTLFGMGWSAPHRVLKNEATAKWISQQSPSKFITCLNKSAEPFAKYLPPYILDKIHQMQSLKLPVYSPIAPNASMMKPRTEYSALYAGQCVSQISDTLPAAKIVQQLAQGL